MSKLSFFIPKSVHGEGSLYYKKPKFGFDPNASFSVRVGA